jgi:F-box/leucine-rich repeat protein 10/11
MVCDDYDANADADAESNYANRHVAAFLELYSSDKHDTFGSSSSSNSSSSSSIQVCVDGSKVTAQAFDSGSLSLQRPIWIQDTAASIGMKVLKGGGSAAGSNKPVSVANLVEIVGPAFPIAVIDVEHQEELDGWTLQDLAEYWQDPDRLAWNASMKSSSGSPPQINQVATGRVRRQAVLNAAKRRRPRVLNQISLEFSRTALAGKIQSPTIVRELDWIDRAYPDKTAEQYPQVQYYCLTSAAGCYTDFHLDFGGTSVWYHVMTGTKVFCLIPPTQDNLTAYQDWLCRPNQAGLFLPDLLKSKATCGLCTVQLQAGQTLLIPSGWIHAVYTTQDSIVAGGNFLHGLAVKQQLQVHTLENQTRVLEKFRFPLFRQTHFRMATWYLQQLRVGKPLAVGEMEGLPVLLDALGGWWKHVSALRDDTAVTDSGAAPTLKSAAIQAARQSQCATVPELLAALRAEHDRVVQNGVGPSPTWTQKSECPIKKSARPRLRLKLSTASGHGPASSKANKQEDNFEDGPFRINISVKALQPHSAPPTPSVVVRSTPKEDVDWYVGERTDTRDEEWKPSVQPVASKTMSSFKRSTTLQSSSTAMQGVAKKPKTTARQRLLKKVRR